MKCNSSNLCLLVFLCFSIAASVISSGINFILIICNNDNIIITSLQRGRVVIQ